MKEAMMSSLCLWEIKLISAIEGVYVLTNEPEDRRPENLLFRSIKIRQVSTEEGEDKAKQENIMFIETSAKVGRKTSCARAFSPHC